MTRGIESEDLDLLQDSLGYRFRDPALLEAALTHRSHSHERAGEGSANYERLEFLGDALLGFIVGDWLFRDDPQAPEGVLSRRRQSVVRARTLAATARALGLGDAVRLGRGEQLTGGRRKASLLADLFEAMLGAIYLDGGIRHARSFVRRHLGEALREIRLATSSTDDFKTQLQEHCQAELQATPRYRIVSTTGPAHALEFEAEVVVGGNVVGRGKGSNRKGAEQSAAAEALQALTGRRGEDR
jgi:ribonuclease-3